MKQFDPKNGWSEVRKVSQEDVYQKKFIRENKSINGVGESIIILEASIVELLKSLNKIWGADTKKELIHLLMTIRRVIDQLATLDNDHFLGLVEKKKIEDDVALVEGHLIKMIVNDYESDVMADMRRYFLESVLEKFIDFKQKAFESDYLVE
jgi:hypothetical protein